MKKDKPIKLCLFALYTELWVCGCSALCITYFICFYYFFFFLISSDFAIQTQPLPKSPKQQFISYM